MVKLTGPDPSSRACGATGSARWLASKRFLVHHRPGPRSVSGRPGGLRGKNCDIHKKYASDAPACARLKRFTQVVQGAGGAPQCCPRRLCDAARRCPSRPCGHRRAAYRASLSATAVGIKTTSNSVRWKRAISLVVCRKGNSVGRLWGTLSWACELMFPGQRKGGRGQRAPLDFECTLPIGLWKRCNALPGQRRGSPSRAIRVR